MFEKAPNQENNKVTRTEVLQALKTNGKENPETKELLSKFIEESRKEVEKITTKKEHYKASIECSINNATLFYEAGYIQEAFDDLLETLEIARQAGEENLANKINEILNKIENNLDS